MARTKSHVRNHVRQLREAAGNLTQQGLADALGVSRQTIIAIEQGRYSPSLESALRLEKIFAKPVSEIFELED